VGPIIKVSSLDTVRDIGVFRVSQIYQTVVKVSALDTVEDIGVLGGSRGVVLRDRITRPPSK
jgi:hypothetical protein